MSIPASGWDNYKYLQESWQKHGMTTFNDFLQWYNNKDVVPTLEAMQKMVQFYHQKEKDVKTWMYSSKSGKHLSAQINQ